MVKIISISQNIAITKALDWIIQSCKLFREAIATNLVYTLLFLSSRLLAAVIPVLGDLFSIFILSKMYLCFGKIITKKPYSVEIGILGIFKQSQLIKFALFSSGISLVSTLMLNSFVTYYYSDSYSILQNGLTVKIIFLVIILEMLKFLIIGILAPLCTFFGGLPFFALLRLNLKFMQKHLITVLCSFGMLICLFIIPAYLLLLGILASSNSLFQAIGASLLLMLCLIYTTLNNMLIFNIYKDAIVISDETTFQAKSI